MSAIQHAFEEPPAHDSPSVNSRALAGTPVNENFPKSDAGPQFASFPLEVRNCAQVTNELVERISAIMAASGFDVTLTPTQVFVESIRRANLPSASTRAEVRGEARLVNWTQDGTLVEGGKVEAARGVKRQTVDAARERGEIFSVDGRG